MGRNSTCICGTTFVVPPTNRSYRASLSTGTSVAMANGISTTAAAAGTSISAIDVEAGTSIGTSAVIAEYLAARDGEPRHYDTMEKLICATVAAAERAKYTTSTGTSAAEVGTSMGASVAEAGTSTGASAVMGASDAGELLRIHNTWV